MRVDKNGRVVDNTWIVPYSPRLLKKYKCHICVEVCTSVKGVKYLYKYVYKGPDRAMVAVTEANTDVNEIELYQDKHATAARGHLSIARRPLCCVQSGLTPA